MDKTYQEIKVFYRERLQEYLSYLNKTTTQIRKISIWRILIFILTVTGIFVGSAYHWIPVVSSAIVGFSLFFYLIAVHIKLFKEKQWLETLVKINQAELDLMDGKTAGKPNGSNWLNPEHPFAGDLALFGEKSLFQLIDRSATLKGQNRLAKILLNPYHDEKKLFKRQQAISELKNRPDWRQSFQASGIISREQTDDIEHLIHWSQNKKPLFNTFIFRALLVINPLAGFLVVTLIAFNLIDFSAFLLFLLLPMAVFLPKLKLINFEHGKLEKKSLLLNKYSDLLRLIEQENFKTTLLQNQKAKLVSSDDSASNAIKKLSKILKSFDYRLNMLVGIFLNVFFLWDIRQMIRLEKWKNTHQKKIVVWFETLARFDELCSFSGFAFNHPNSVFPKFSEKGFRLVAHNLRHPLIPENRCVGNPVSFTNWEQFHIITGANMAGKSTYLRTTGINLVIAMTGLPVLADEFIFKPVNLYTGIKTNDSLQDGESYFFAELKRLETIIRQLEKGNKLFIILDEILKGTNSADKQKGSKALINQFLKLGASGMIATHDLKLGELASLFPDHVTNKRFEVEIENNELVFDYRLKEGISQNLNATFLMKKMGITID